MADRQYSELAAALAVEGIRCQFQTPGQMVVSRQVGPIWPGNGNSFWVTRVEGQWYLFTWAPFGYQVPLIADMRELCVACMAWSKSAMGKVPAAIAEAFGLVALTEEQEERVYRGMDGQ